MKLNFLLLMFICASSQSPIAEENLTPKLEPLTLNEAVERGLKSNLDLIAARFSIPQAEADALTAGLFNNPSILIDTSFQPLNSGNWDQTSAGGPRQYDLIFSYPFDFSGKRSSAQKSAKEAVKVTEASFQDSIRQKIRDIRLAYFDLLASDQHLTLAKEKEDRLRHLVEVLEKKTNQKQIQPLLVLRSQLARDQARLDAEQREIARRTAKNNMAVFLGFSESISVLPTSKLRDFKMNEIPEKDKLIESSYENRPDLKALNLALNKSSFDRDLARAQTWDNFNVTLGLSSQGPTAGNANASYLGQAYSWNFGVTIPLPTFNRNQGNVQKTSLVEEQTNKQILALKLAISQEVAALYDQLAAGRHLIEAYESKQLKQARDVRDAQAKLYGTGSSGLLDYFDGINSYVTVYSSYYDAVTEYRKNLARLNAAIGKDQF